MNKLLTKEYKNLSDVEFYTKFFEFLNSIQSEDKLTDREIAVAAEFLALKPNYEFTRFGRESRKLVAENINSKNDKKKNFTVNNLNVALQTLKSKGVIIEDKENKKVFHPYILDKTKKSEITFQIKLEKESKDDNRNSSKENRGSRKEST